jgi:site-specific recombinase XerC
MLLGSQLRQGWLLEGRVRRHRPAAVRDRAEGVAMTPRDGVESGGNEKRPGSAETLRGRHQEVSPDATPTLLLAEAARVWREAVKNKAYRQFPLGQEAGTYLRQNRGRLLPNTYKTYESCLDKLARYFADLELADLEPPMGTERLEEFVDDQWGDQSARTRAKNISVLKGFFKWAVLTGRLHGDPALPLVPPKKRGVLREAFSDDERARIVADGPDPDSLHRDRCALRLLLNYGLRKDSLRRIQFRHFDHNRRRLTIFAKGGKVRTLPIVEAAFWDDLGRHMVEWEAQSDDYLLCRRSLRPNRHKAGEKFVTEYRDQPMGVHGLHKWWYRCLARAGIVSTGTTSGRKMHGARYTAGQHVLDDTGNLKAVQKLLGHSSIQTTADIYTDWDIDQLADTMRQVLEGDEA